MTDITDLLVFVLVLAARLGVPLFIPRFPLAAILVALVLDGVDQTIFQTFTNLNLDGYQGYDKALDVYYLTIAYLSTLRNWTNLSAVMVSRFLLYYRLVGVVLFELTEARVLLLIFPNTFEYFFIFVEAVRLRWDPVRMSPRLVVAAAAAIWICIKLPQEWWIHIAKLDVTDVLGDYPALVPGLVVLLLAIVLVAWWLITRRLPDPDHRPSLDADSRQPSIEVRTTGAHPMEPDRFLNASLFEKIALVSLVTIIFSQILPDVDATATEITVGVGVLIVANTAISEWLKRRGVGWETAARQFAAMVALNGGLTVTTWLFLPSRDGDIHLGNTLFFLLLLTLLITLYDRFHPIHMARLPSRGGWPWPASETQTATQQ